MITQDNLQIYRQRFIPPECILLKDDTIVRQTEDLIITNWTTLKPKAAFQHGCSCYFLKKGIKVSKYYRADDTLLFWYCDIVDYSYDEEKHALTVTDLLADVIIYPDGFVKVVDLDEMVPALECGGISVNELKKALLSCNALLSLIYNGKLSQLTKYIESFESL